MLGNALEGVPVEEEEEGDEDKTKDPDIEGTENMDGGGGNLIFERCSSFNV